MAVLRAVDVHKFYAEKVLDGVTVELGKGEIVGIVGPNGCGKTTLLRIMAGLEVPDSGTVERRADSLGIVFQDNRLLPWKTLYQNIALGLKYRGLPALEIRERVLKYARELNLSEAELSLYPGKASGGMRKKAALARSLVLEPEVLLLDEPFTGLDVKTIDSLKSFLKEVIREGGISTIIVSHQLEDLLTLAERAYLLTHRPSRVAYILNLSGRGLEERVNIVREALLHLIEQVDHNPEPNEDGND